MSNMHILSLRLQYFVLICCSLVHQCSQLCNNEMFSILSRVTDLYFDDLVIMQHVSTIVMFFSSLEGWESSLMESGLIQKITSFTYSVCQDPIPSISLPSSVYPLVSITRNLSLSGGLIVLFSHSQPPESILFSAITCCPALRTCTSTAAERTTSPTSFAAFFFASPPLVAFCMVAHCL